MPTVLVTLVLPLALPYAAISAGLTSPLRMLFPLFALLVGIALTRGHRLLYPGFVLAVFAFTAFLRRVIDERSGFELFNLILLAPYTALLPALPALWRRLAGHGGGLRVAFITLVVLIIYATFIAVLEGKVAAAGNEPMRWILPIAMCAFIMDRPQDLPPLRRAITTSLLLILPVLSVYGVQQYLNPQLWDVLWMQNVDIGAFGLPEAYEIRVFSMMNSPLSVAAFAVSGMILLIGEGLVGLVVALTAVPLLAITLVRASWLLGAVALLVMLVLAPMGRRLVIVLGIVVAATVFTGALTSQILPATITNPLMTRFASFTDLRGGTDVSAGDRQQTYASMFRRLGESPLGEGFGANGSAVGRSERRDLVPLDSAILEGAVTFGVIGGAAYLLSILVIFISAMRAGLAARETMAAAVALLAGLLATTPIGQNLIGETSIIGWIAIGLLLAHAEQARTQVSVASRPPPWPPAAG